MSIYMKCQTNHTLILSYMECLSFHESCKLGLDHLGSHAI